MRLPVPPFVAASVTTEALLVWYMHPPSQATEETFASKGFPVARLVTAIRVKVVVQAIIGEIQVVGISERDTSPQRRKKRVGRGDGKILRQITHYYQITTILVELAESVNLRWKIPDR